MHVEPEIPQDQFHEEDLNPEIFPNLRITEHSIRPPSSALYPSYVATSLPSPDAPSSHDHWISRAFHDVEKRQRSRPSSQRGANRYAQPTRTVRTAIRSASSRRLDSAQYTYQLPPSSSLWTGLVQARDHRVKQVPEPTPIPDEHAANFILSDPCGSLGERDDSPNFDGDVESGEIARREYPTSAKERLTIIVPGGKSEAYVTMAFGRSCSLNDNGRADHDMSYILPITPPASEEQEEVLKGARKTGLKIRIPAPNPLLMLSLRLADSCHVSDIDRTEEDEGKDWVKYSRTCVSSESEYLSTDSTLGSIRHVLPNPLPPGPNPAAAFAHKDRVVRRVARRVAQLPYAVNRFQAPTSRRRLEY